MLEWFFVGTLAATIGTSHFAVNMMYKKKEKERLENKRFEIYDKELEKAHRNDVAELAMIRINQEMRNLEKASEGIDQEWKVKINEKIRKSKPIVQKYNELPFEKRMEIEEDIRDMLVHILQEIEKEKKETNKELKEKFAEKIKEVTST